MSASDIRQHITLIEQSYRGHLTGTTSLCEADAQSIKNTIIKTYNIIKVISKTTNIVLRSMFAILLWCWRNKLTTALGITGLTLGPNVMMSAYDVTTKAAHFVATQGYNTIQIAVAWHDWLEQISQIDISLSTLGNLFNGTLLPPSQGIEFFKGFKSLVTSRGEWITNSVQGMMQVLAQKWNNQGSWLEFAQHLLHLAIEMFIPGVIVLGLLRLWRGGKTAYKDIFKLLDDNKAHLRVTIDHLTKVLNTVPVPSPNKQLGNVKQLGNDKPAELRANPANRWDKPKE